MPKINIGSGLLEISDSNGSDGLMINMGFRANGLFKGVQNMLDIRKLFK